MNKRATAYAMYWRNSLADADLGQGTLTREKLSAFRRVSPEEARAGVLHQDTIDAYFEGEAENVTSVEVIFRPVLYIAKNEHGKRSTNLPENISPIVVQALLTREGYLLPKPKTVVPRNILQPLEPGSFSVGNIADLDRFLTERQVPGIATTDVSDDEGIRPDVFERCWSAHLDTVHAMLEAVCGAFVTAPGQFMRAAYGLISRIEVIDGASQHVIRLYDHMRDHGPDVPLFETYAREATAPLVDCKPPNSEFSARLAHSSDQFPLADAQRVALGHLLTASDGEILAVNGPPGTGKTTLLLSVVASLWARAALDETEPPVIFAASTNNQAVTNVIDAFGKDFSKGEGVFAARWLPDIASFGAYFPSQRRETESAGKYQTNAFFQVVESPEYAERATAEYLSRAKTAFPDMEAPDLQVVVSRLHSELRASAERLKTVELAWQLLVKARADAQADLGPNPAAMILSRQSETIQLSAETQRWNTLKRRWDAFRASESLFYALFSWLPPVAEKRLRLARQHLKSVVSDEEATTLGKTLPQIDDTIDTRIAILKRAHETVVLALKKGEALLESVALAEKALIVAAKAVGTDASAHTPSLSECDSAADTALRFQIFLLTTHYWEGRWLLEMQRDMPKILSMQTKRNPGPRTLVPRWRRRMMITPCAVSTFAMLPAYLLTYVRGEGKFKADYLYKLIDLLIVDEAGQVLPEVAGASFALARKALVIGDTQQIEPIWSTVRSVDYGNLVSLGLLTGSDGDLSYEELTASGKLASNGSVMRVAQRACRYHPEEELDRGLYLYEHRRCYNEIIEYSNKLCYRGRLLPRRGAVPADVRITPNFIPPMAYLHVDGMCESLQSGSRRNQLEADTIAAWLAENRAALEAKYGMPLAKTVGILTPFAGQVAAIEAACAKLDIKVGREDGMVTAGTVHALQGAERHVVIFSPVYSKHEDGRFIDNSTSMLNVAVSRAKDNFLVFGDMDVFESAASNTPRGLLASFLFRFPDNRLLFEPRKRPDLQTPTTEIRQLRDATEHDAFLLNALDTSKISLQIVSPWIRLSRAREIGAWDAMVSAVSRGIKVEIYTDPQLNTDGSGSGSLVRTEAQLLSDADELRAAGISVHFVRRVHSKLVIGDEDLYCVGSFNWLSASRLERYARHETSLVYRGNALSREILTIRKSLLQRRITSAPYVPRRQAGTAHLES